MKYCCQDFNDATLERTITYFKEHDNSAGLTFSSFYGAGYFLTNKRKSLTPRIAIRYCPYCGVSLSAMANLEHNKWIDRNKLE